MARLDTILGKLPGDLLPLFTANHKKHMGNDMAMYNENDYDENGDYFFVRDDDYDLDDVKIQDVFSLLSSEHGQDIASEAISESDLMNKTDEWMDFIPFFVESDHAHMGLRFTKIIHDYAEELIKKERYCQIGNRWYDTTRPRQSYADIKLFSYFASEHLNKGFALEHINVIDGQQGYTLEETDGVGRELPAILYETQAEAIEMRQKLLLAG